MITPPASDALVVLVDGEPRGKGGRVGRDPVPVVLDLLVLDLLVLALVITANVAGEVPVDGRADRGCELLCGRGGDRIKPEHVPRERKAEHVRRDQCGTERGRSRIAVVCKARHRREYGLG